MSNLSEEEKKAIEYYQGKEFSFEIEGNMEELKKALGITDNEEDSFESHQIRIQTLLNLIDRLQKELEQEKENNEKQFRIDTAEEVLKWKSKYHLLSRKINGVLEDKIRDRINEIGQKECEDMQTILFKYFIIEMLEELLEE